MLPRNHPNRIHVAFDDHRLVAPGCSFRPLWPSTWVWVNWLTTTLTWGMRRGGRTRETR